MSLAVEWHFHSEKYRSIIKKMYQNSYSLRVAIKTERPACSACLTLLSNNSHSVIYRAVHVVVPRRKGAGSVKKSGAADRRGCLNGPTAMCSRSGLTTQDQIKLLIIKVTLLGILPTKPCQLTC